MTDPDLAARQATQRADWRAALAAKGRAQRNRRGKRPGPQITGVVKQPPATPKPPPGRNS